MIRFIFILLTTCTLIACSEQKEEVIPEEIVSEEKFIDIITDVKILEGRLHHKVNAQDIPKIAPDLYQEIFDKHDITKEGFRKNIIYHFKTPEKTMRIYETVVEQLTVISKQIPEEKVEEDNPEKED